jgi:hypothetical protein
VKKEKEGEKKRFEVPIRERRKDKSEEGQKEGGCGEALIISQARTHKPRS